MRVFKKKSLKLNNAGMTLIELLIAIAIMAVALAPLLYAFVNVARYNDRSREVQQTTTLAHTVMENCKAYSMGDINTRMGNGTFLDGVTATQTYHDTGSNTYYMTNVAVEDEKYDIALKFTPRGVNGDATTSFDIIETQSMNPYLDAVFTPEGTMFTSVTIGGVSYGDVTAAELDQLAYLDFLQDISDGIKMVSEADLGTGNGIVLTQSAIEDSFKDSSNLNYNKFSCSRKTTIWLADMASFEMVEVTILYSFDTVDHKYYYKHIKPDGTEKIYSCSAHSEIDFSEIIYNNSSTNDASHPTKIENVYFFYYPGYQSVGGTGAVFPFDSDTFLVSNTLAGVGTRTANVYLLKQKNPAYSEANLATLEATYTTHVDCYYPTGISSGTNIYHNFDVNLGGGGNPPYSESSWFASGLNIQPELIENDNKVLMYDVELKVYDAGSYNMSSHVLDLTAQPVITMDGTTLNW